METKLNERKMELGHRKLGFVNGINVATRGTIGGLTLCWKENSLVSLRSFSNHHIDVNVRDNEKGINWRFISFYGCPEEKNKHLSWKLLRQLGRKYNGPWLVLGDLNEILYSFEKKGGRLRSERKMSEFRQALEDCGLSDLGFNGSWFTWEKGGSLRPTFVKGLIEVWFH